jgi:hypothetical protein
MIFGTRQKTSLGLGVALYALALVLTPGELAAAKARTKVGGRTAATVVLYLAAAVLVLGGLPRPAAPPPLPER